MISHRGPEALSNRSLEDKPFDPFMQQAGIEINEQADMKACDSQISEELRLENRIKSFYTFQFQNDSPFDDEVQPVFTDQLSSIVDRNRNLPLKSDLGKRKFDSQSGFVDRFQQTRPQPPMNFNRTTDDAACYIALFRPLHFECAFRQLCGSVTLWLQISFHRRD